MGQTLLLAMSHVTVASGRQRACWPRMREMVCLGSQVLTIGAGTL